MTEARLILTTLKYIDGRLPARDLVWTFYVRGAYVAYTETFVREQEDLINTRVGDQEIVVNDNNPFESLGVYYNHMDQIWGISYTVHSEGVARAKIDSYAQVYSQTRICSEKEIPPTLSERYLARV